MGCRGTPGIRGHRGLEVGERRVFSAPSYGDPQSTVRPGVFGLLIEGHRMTALKKRAAHPLQVPCVRGCQAYLCNPSGTVVDINACREKSRRVSIDGAVKRE